MRLLRFHHAQVRQIAYAGLLKHAEEEDVTTLVRPMDLWNLCTVHEDRLRDSMYHQ